jgi:beta-galactosidase GanA
MTSDTKSIPRLEKTKNSQQLIVDGNPFLILGDELQNSSMTSAACMNTVWHKLVDTNINTVLGCVTWEDIEPTEGHFDFSELD